jgi:hypothetical protein
MNLGEGTCGRTQSRSRETRVQVALEGAGPVEAAVESGEPSGPGCRLELGLAGQAVGWNTGR